MQKKLLSKFYTNMAANLADLMCHRTEAAPKCYPLVNREKTSGEAACKQSVLTGAGASNVAKIFQTQSHVTSYCLGYLFSMLTVSWCRCRCGRTLSEAVWCKHRLFPQHSCETRRCIVSSVWIRNDLAFFRLPTAISEQSKVPSKKILLHFLEENCTWLKKEERINYRTPFLV